MTIAFAKDSVFVPDSGERADDERFRARLKDTARDRKGRRMSDVARAPSPVPARSITCVGVNYVGFDGGMMNGVSLKRAYSDVVILVEDRWPGRVSRGAMIYAALRQMSKSSSAGEAN